MSQFTVNLESGSPEPDRRKPTETPRSSRKKKAAIVLVVIAMVGAVGAFAYWQRIKSSPQYSLALLVEAARRDDQQLIDRLVDTDSVVDSFLPQVIDKAVEMYGRNLPPNAMSALNSAADQVKPMIKRRAREEVPRVIREKTDKFESVPYWAIAIGGGWYLDIKTEGDTATVRSLIENRPFELTMKRNGDVWRVVAIKDEIVAKRIAEKIGQELITITSREGLNKAAEKLGIKSLDEIKKKLEGIFK